MGKTQHRRAWTQPEIDILKTHAATLTTTQIHKTYLPNRSPGTIAAKINQLGLNKNRKPRMPEWSQEEDEILKQHASKMPTEEIHKTYLPNRTPIAIAHRISMLGFGQTTNAPWTASELNYLKNHYPTDTLASIAKRLGRTTGTVATRAKMLGLRKNINAAGYHGSPHWTQAEDQILIDNQDKMTYEEIHEKLLPHRTVNAIGIRYVRLQRPKLELTPWSDTEIKTLKANFAKLSRTKMHALLPGRTQMAIRAKASQLKLKKKT